VTPVWRARWGALALFMLLTVVHTWPLANEPGRWGRNTSADTQLNAWTLAWVAHQIVRDPLHLFDANIFYPEKRTLAFSEHLLPQALIAAPISWAGGSAIRAYNIALLAGFALTGWATAIVVQRWTASWPAGILSGSLMAFNAMTLTRFPHIQLQHLEFFPLALFAFDRLLAEPRPTHALRLAAWYVLQALTSAYFLVFTAIALGASALARAGDWLGSRARIVLPQLALAALAAVAALLPFVLPYLMAGREQQDFERTLPEVAQFSAQLTDYLATGGTLHHDAWSSSFFRGDGLFPGITALALTLFAIATGTAWSDRRARMALAFGAVCFCLSFGPAFPLYSYFYTVFPPMAGIRAASRFGQMVLAAMAILAGFGMATLLRRARPERAGLIAGALLLAVHVEAARMPIEFSEDDYYRGVPPIFKTLDTPEPHIVAVFPFYPAEQIFRNGRYMLASTVFWKPMLNGYSGYIPARYLEHVENLGGFPDERSLRYLQALGVTRVLVDARSMRPDALDRIRQFPALTLLGSDGNLRIYDVSP
jgi:hypothetical protein